MDAPFRVLLAEDEKAVAVCVMIALRGPGYAFETAPDGQVALDWIQANPDHFDLLITDDCMPNLRGVDLIRRLRKMNFRGNIIVLSGYLSPEMKSAYGELNVDGMIEKPFDIHEFRVAVEGVAACHQRSLPER